MDTGPGGANSCPEAGTGVEMEIILNSPIPACLSHITSLRPPFGQAPMSLSELEQKQSHRALEDSILSSVVRPQSSPTLFSTVPSW